MMNLEGARLKNFFNLGGKISEDGMCSGRFVIPHYQRPYKWGDDKADGNSNDENRIAKLISDFFDHFDSDQQEGQDRKYFGGSAVAIIRKNETWSYDLIDGQQRYTTLFLFNYLRFLISRACIRVEIEKKNQFQKYKEILNESLSYLFQKDAGITMIQERLTDIEENYSDVEYRNNNSEVALAEYCALVGLPNGPEDATGYAKGYSELLHIFLTKAPLTLNYARATLNEALIHAMSSVCFRVGTHQAPKLTVIEKTTYSEIESFEALIPSSNAYPYLNAILIIFLKLSGRAANSDSNNIKKAKLLIESINNLLTFFYICLVHTNDESSAYLLFEVLNDRSLALEDLDLIKNTFYRRFCASEVNSSSDSTSRELDGLEKKWGSVFEQRDTDFTKKYVAYFALQFITGSPDLMMKGKRGHLKEAVLKRLDDQYSSLSYDTQAISSDFEVFLTVKDIFAILDLPGKETKGAALDAFCQTEISDIKKVFFLCHAIKAEGILACLTSPLLSYLHSNKFRSREERKVEIQRLFRSVPTDDEMLMNINDLARHMLIAIIASKDYNSPLRLFRPLRNRYPKSRQASYAFNKINLSEYIAIMATLKDEFYSWTKSWTYKTRDDFKVKILFLNAYMLSCRNEKEIYKDAMSGGLDIDDYHLDHLEPQTYNESSVENYFMDQNRKSFVDSLGNVLLIPGFLNSALGNAPMKSRLEAIVHSAGSRWLVSNTQTIFLSNSSGQKPLKEFFEVRLLWLQDAFFKCLDVTLTKKPKRLD